MIDMELVCKVNQLKEKFPCSTERMDSTPTHNASVGGAKGSYHIDTPDHKACAVDLSFDNAEDLIPASKYAVLLGFGGVEVDFRNNHLHLDLRQTVWHVVCTKQRTMTLNEYLTTSQV